MSCRLEKGVNFTLAFAAAIYAFLIYRSLSPYWFNPEYTTDDALQQSFPFHALKHPEVFSGDLIRDAMLSYLPPTHYGVWHLITLFTENPIQTGHWVMALQIVAALSFLFFTVRHCAGLIPALFAVIWFLHSRNLILSMTGGLTRGWAAPLCAAFLFFAATKRHRGVLIVLLLGITLHPPATIVCALAYGVFLVGILLIEPKVEDKKTTKKLLTRYLLLCPFYAAFALFVLHRPDYIGSMAGPELAAEMPSFARPGGRFAFMPLPSVWQEVHEIALRPFANTWRYPGEMLANGIFFGVLLLFAVLLLSSVLKHRAVIPGIFLCCLASVFVCYFAARALVFYLYVPDRYLQGPLSVFLIAAFSVGVWRALYIENWKELRWNFGAKKKVGILIGLFLGSAVLSFLILAYSYPSVMTPEWNKGGFSKIARDGWIEQGASIELNGLMSRGNSALFYFDHWRPAGLEPAELELSLCGKVIGKFSVTKERPEHQVPLTASCHAPEISFSVVNPFVPPSASDNRKLGARLRKVQFRSAFGPPLVSADKLRLLVLVIYFISLLFFLSIEHTTKDTNFERSPQSFMQSALSALGLLGLALLVTFGSGTGIEHHSNFNVHIGRKGELYNWMFAQTPHNALFAGHPSHIDEIQLVGVRKALITTETAHPFYDKYFEEVRRRMNTTWRAYYAKSSAAFLQQLEPEKVDYFVFRKTDFSKKALRRATYDKPFDRLLKQLTKSSPEGYFYSAIKESYPAAIVFEDEQSLVVDVSLLKKG